MSSSLPFLPSSPSLPTPFPTHILRSLFLDLVSKNQSPKTKQCLGKTAKLIEVGNSPLETRTGFLRDKRSKREGSRCELKRRWLCPQYLAEYLTSKQHIPRKEASGRGSREIIEIPSLSGKQQRELASWKEPHSGHEG